MEKKKTTKKYLSTLLYIVFFFCSCSSSDLTFIFGNMTSKLKIHSCANCYGFIWKMSVSFIFILKIVCSVLATWLSEGVHEK